MLNRSQVNSDINSNVYTNNLELIKGDTVRDRLLVLSNNSLNILTDAGQPGGYVNIDNAGLANIAVIKAASPAGKFLMDNGTWDNLTATWATITGNIEDNAALSAALDAKIDLAYLDLDILLTANSDSRIPSQKAIKTYIGNLVVNYEPIIGLGTTGQYWRGDKTWQAFDWKGTLANDPTTDGNNPIISDGDFLYLGSSSKGKVYYNTGSSRSEIMNTMSGDLIYLSDTGGITAALSSGQFMRLESGQFLVYGNVAGTAHLQTGTSDNQIYHPTVNNFSAPLHDFITGSVRVSSQTANTLPWLNATKDITSTSIISDGDNLFFVSGNGIDVVATGGSDVLNIGGNNADVINIGGTGTTINLIGNITEFKATQSTVADQLITINKGGPAGSAGSSGFEIEENAIITGYFKTTAARDGYQFKSPGVTYKMTLDLSALVTADRIISVPDAAGTIVLTSTLASIGFAQGGNAFGATAVLGTTDNYALQFITNNTTRASFTTSGFFEIAGGNGTNSMFALHQNATNAAGSARIMDVYNSSYSKQMLAILDDGSAGYVMLANGSFYTHAYTGNSSFGIGVGAARVGILAGSAGQDIIAINPSTGNGGLYANDGSTGNPYFYGQDATAATVLLIATSGVSYFAGGAVDVRATGGSGYLGLYAQSSNVSAPASGLRIFAGATGSFNWVRNNGADTFVRTFDSTLTADRSWSMPDMSGTFALATGVTGGQTIIGGTAVGDILTLKGTTGNGTSSVAAIQLLVGNNGGTAGVKVYNSGQVDLPTIGTNGISFQGLVGTTTTTALYMNQSTPSATNYTLWATAAGQTVLNAPSSINIRINDGNRMVIGSSGYNIATGQGTAGTSIWQLTFSNNSSQTAGTNVPKWIATLGTTSWATGSLVQADFVQWTQPSVLFSGASTATLASTFTINGAPIASTNATITSSAALYIGAGSSLTSSVTTGYGIYVNAPTGAGTNWAIYSAGGTLLGVSGSDHKVLINVGTSTSTVSFMGRVGATTNAAMYLAVASGSESNTNYVLSWDGSLRINAQSTTSIINMLCGNTGVFAICPAGSTSQSFYTFATRNRSSLTASAQAVVFDVVGSTQTWAAGTLAAQYMGYFRTQTLAFASASTATYVSSLTVEYTTRGSNATFTTTSAIYIPTLAYTSTTTAIGLDIEAPTGATNNYALRLGGDVKINGAYNFILDTTTGTKFGTATSQKIGFFNATPIIQPVNTTAIDDVLINLGLRASGGSANFTLKVTHNLPENLKSYTVATLPAGVQGDYCYVTDALAPTYGAVIVGGGSVKTPVFYDGTNWTAH